MLFSTIILMHASTAQEAQEPHGKTVARKRAAEMQALKMQTLRDTVDILQAENKVKKAAC